MTPGKPSQTAEFVAILRANHALFAPEPKLLRDSLATKMTNYETAEQISAYVETIVKTFAQLADPEAAAIFVRRIEQSVCLRSRLLEERLKAMKKDGLKQFILFGAGMDTSAYRLLDELEGLDVYEVDHPATQAWKREKLASSGVSIPNNLSFMPFDFENQTLMQALRAGGLSFDAKSLIGWLGVQMYLTPEAVKSTLETAAGFAKGSELIMDFTMPDYDHDYDVMPDSVEKLGKVVASMGEPFLSRYTAADLAAVMKEAGFSSSVFYDTPKAVKEILGGDDTNYDMPKDAVFLARAIV